LVHGSGRILIWYTVYSMQIDSSLPDPLRAHATGQIRLRILSSALPPGVRVNEGALARELGISRTPLREALFGLEREGLVVSHARRGFFVSPLDVKDAREVYPLLASLEALALRMGAKEMAADRVALERLNSVFRAAAAVDPSGAVEADRAWHERLVSHCGNERLIVMVQQLRGTALRFELHFLSERRSVLESARQHAAILDATVQGAVAKAARLLEDNWMRGLRRVEQAVTTPFELEAFVTRKGTAPRHTPKKGPL
jgi:DNA-binding GntR family transcriptional regulator